MSKINIEIIKQFPNAFKFEKEADKSSLELYLNDDTKKEYKGTRDSENVLLIDKMLLFY